MPSNDSHKIALLIKAAYPLPSEVEAALSDALNDLYNGPCFHDEGMNYAQACGILKNYADDNLPSTLYVDLDCDGVYECEPQGYSDDYEDEDGETVDNWVEPSPYYEVSRKDIWAAVMGAAIVNEGGLY